MTESYLLSKTLYGVDIMQHIIRKAFPDHIMHVRGDDCGDCPDPIAADGTILSIFVQKTSIPGKPLPEREARFHSVEGTIPDGNAIDLALAYYKAQGEPLTREQVIARLASELYIKDPPQPRKPTSEQSHIITLGGQQIDTREYRTPTPEEKKAIRRALLPLFSWFSHPIRNVLPLKDAQIFDVWKYLRSTKAKYITDKLRATDDKDAARKFKASNFDYVTFSGLFRSRKEDALIKHSGFLCFDFDHIPDVDALKAKLIADDSFTTALAFRSPSGDGLKWVIEIDLTRCTHQQWFAAVSNYLRQTYGVEADPSGKDICRACFIPHDPDAYINEKYHFIDDE